MGSSRYVSGAYRPHAAGSTASSPAPRTGRRPAPVRCAGGCPRTVRGPPGTPAGGWWRRVLLPAPGHVVQSRVPPDEHAPGHRGGRGRGDVRPGPGPERAADRIGQGVDGERVREGRPQPVAVRVRFGARDEGERRGAAVLRRIPPSRPAVRAERVREERVRPDEQRRQVHPGHLRQRAVRRVRGGRHRARPAQQRLAQRGHRVVDVPGERRPGGGRTGPVRTAGLQGVPLAPAAQPLPPQGQAVAAGGRAPSPPRARAGPPTRSGGPGPTAGRRPTGPGPGRPGADGPDRHDPGRAGAEPAVQDGLEGVAGLRQRMRERGGGHELFVQRKKRAATAPKSTPNTTSPAHPTPMSERPPRPVRAADTASLR